MAYLVLKTVTSDKKNININNCFFPFSFQCFLRVFDRKCFGFVTIIYAKRREYFIAQLFYPFFISVFNLIVVSLLFALFSPGLSLSVRLKR